MIISLYYKTNQMIDQTLQANLREQLRTAAYSEVMNEEFISAYRQALKFSNLEVDKDLKYRNIPIYGDEHMHQVYTTGSRTLPHLVLLHGYGGTSLTFVRTFQHLKDHFQVHALDTFGVGLSSRKTWKNDLSVQDTITYYIDAVQQWRKTTGIQHFILAGHSFGGYISAFYYEKYSERVKQLVLLSPAGSGKISEQAINARAERSKFFFWFAQKVFSWGIRPSKVMGTCWIGEKFMNKVLNGRLKLPEDEKEAWRKYLSHLVKINQTSQGGFYTLFKWPLQPVKSIEQVLRGKPPSFKVDFLFGDNDWMSKDGAQRLVKDYNNMRIHQINDAGHQLIFDNPEKVTQKIREVVHE